MLKQIRACAEISKECMDHDPDKRPVIKHIIEKLAETQKNDNLIQSCMSTSPTQYRLLNSPWIRKNPLMTLISRTIPAFSRSQYYQIRTL